MKHFKLSATEVIGFIRMRRPGAVNCTQQKYLEEWVLIWNLNDQLTRKKFGGKYSQIGSRLAGFQASRTLCRLCHMWARLQFDLQLQRSRIFPFFWFFTASQFDAILKGLGVHFDIDDMDSVVAFTTRQFRNFFMECRKRIIFPTTTRLPYRLPAVSSRLKMDSKQRWEIYNVVERHALILHNFSVKCQNHVTHWSPE